jgi:hypothetical protein
MDPGSAVITFSLEKSGLLAPGAIERWAQARGADVKGAIIGALRDARPETDRILKQESQRAFKIASQSKFLRAWRIRVLGGSAAEGAVSVSGYGLEITNLARWFKVHTTGGDIAHRSTPRALLIPINTRFGMRITTKKFYKLIDWLIQEKLTVIRNGILYVKPPMNESRRGGVAAGTRVNKRFRQRFQGSKRRPSGFDIKLNEHGLTPIAIIRTSVSMKRTFAFADIVQRRVLPVVTARVVSRFAAAAQRA